MELGSKEYRKHFKLLITPKEREFEKIKFLEVSDKKRLKAIRDLEKELPSNQSHKSIGFMSGGSSFDCYKRKLIVNIYIDEIISKANKIKDKTERTNLLIDERYKEHDNVFDTEKENQAFKIEVSNYIADQLALELNKINKDVDLESDNTIKNETGLTQRQNILLIYYLSLIGDVNFDVGLGKSNYSNQAKTILSLKGVEIPEKIHNNNYYKYWVEVQDNDSRCDKFLNKKNLETLLRYAEKIKNKKLKTEIEKDFQMTNK